MSRYIDADKLSEEISHTYIDNDSALSYRASFDGDTLIGKMQVIDIISEQPTADVQEVRHGKWIREDLVEIVFITEVYLWRCSECGEEFKETENNIGHYHYCTNCGAKMDLDEVKE